MTENDDRYLRQIIEQLQKDVSLLREYSISLTKSTTASMSEISVLRTNIDQFKKGLDEIQDYMVPISQANARNNEEHTLTAQKVNKIEKDVLEIQNDIKGYSVYKEQTKTKFLIHRILIGLAIAISVGAVTVNDYKIIAKIFGGP